MADPQVEVQSVFLLKYKLKGNTYWAIFTLYAVAKEIADTLWLNDDITEIEIRNLGTDKLRASWGTNRPKQRGRQHPASFAPPKDDWNHNER